MTDLLAFLIGYAIVGSIIGAACALLLLADWYRSVRK